MLNSYSASKKKNSYRRSDFDAVLGNSRMLNYAQQPVQGKNPYLEKKWSTMDRRPMQNASYKVNEQEKEKENINTVQSRLDRYNCPSQSPIHQTYVSPMKQSYDPKTRRAALTSRQNNKQINYQQNESRYSYKLGQSKDNTYNYHAKKYNEYKKNAPLTCRSTILYENQSRDEFEKEDQPYTPRQSYQKNPNLTITFSTSNNITPKKAHVELPDELIEKCQFLKQRMERINRMTPKGLTMRERQRQRQRDQQITPEKYHPKHQREPMKESTSSTIVRYNKYCDQKLPLETIYDAQEHRLEHRERETVEQAEQGLQQISCLSKKISERLKQIINRHSN